MKFNVIICVLTALHLVFAEVSPSLSPLSSTFDVVSARRMAFSTPYFFSLFSISGKNKKTGNPIVKEKVVLGEAEIASNSMLVHSFPHSTKTSSSKMAVHEEVENGEVSFQQRGDDAIDDDDSKANLAGEFDQDDQGQTQAQALEIAIDSNFMSDMADGFIEVMHKVKRRREMAEGWEFEWDDSWTPDVWQGPSAEYLASTYLETPKKSQSLRSLIELRKDYKNKADTYKPSQNVQNGYNIAKLSKANEQTDVQR